MGRSQSLMPVPGPGGFGAAGQIRFGKGGSGAFGPGGFDGTPLWVHDLFILLSLVVLIAGVLFVVKLIINRPHSYARSVSGAISELELRYARGEITRDDYWQRRADLTGIGSASQPPATSAAAGGGKKS